MAQKKIDVRKLVPDGKTGLCGILNVTPDSFWMVANTTL